MTKRSLLQAEILQKLASPLAAAVGEVSSRTQGEAQGVQAAQEEAKRTAELLGKTVRLGTTLASKLNIKGADSDAEAVRTMLTIMSGNLIADYYRRTARVPGDNDLNKMMASLEATLSFSDNFIASDEAGARIGQIGAGSVYVDEDQLMTQFINAFIPVVNAVAGFSFGRSESVLVQEITDRLTARARVLRKAALGDNAEPANAGMAELLYLQGLIGVYVQCHNDEVEKMKSKGAGFQAAQDPIAPVWEAFELRATMIEALAEHVAPSFNKGEDETAPQVITEAPAEGMPAAPPQSEQQMNAPVQPQIFSAQPPAQKPVVSGNGESAPPAPPQQEGQQGEAAEENANPMSFFGGGKKKEEGDEGYV